MRILFIGSNPNNSDSLAFERDVTALQKRQLDAAGLDVSFVFLPRCPLEELPLHLAKIRPDVLHFAAHGDDQARLVLSDERGNACTVSADLIRAFVDPDRPPKLVYLSACDSAPIAKALSAAGIPAIGATAPITNAAARASAVVFYDRLIRGCTVATAHEAGRAMLSSINSKSVDAQFFDAADAPLGPQRLLRVPQVIAEPTEAPTRNRDGTTTVTLRFGVVDYPADTVRICFFTPDGSFKNAAQVSHVDDWNGTCCWSGEWNVFDDFLVIVTGASPSSRTFSESLNAAEAMRNCLKLNPPHRESSDEQLAAALAVLSHNVPPSIATKAKRVAGKKQAGVAHKRPSNARRP